MKTLIKNASTGLMIGAILVIAVSGMLLQNVSNELIGGAILLFGAAAIRCMSSD